MKETEPQTEPETEPKTEFEIIFEEGKLEHLKRFCVYSVMFYIPYFLTANIGSVAAVNDLSLFKKLKKFSQVDKLLAEEALATLSRHLWYLSPSTFLFSLASKKLEVDDKSSIVARMLSLPKPDKIKLGYPDFPRLFEKTELRDMFTPYSWQMFYILKMSPDWLALPPAQWDSNPDYIEFRNFVRQVKVTNDCAE